ncbi:hypothetical protein [Crenothrix polyspora]|uniref:Putative Chromosome partitioning protein n=1 Tax=Crenothrix polyspora TaxID=360316 RepID=A0A1R4HGZ9_9GAMM|nr:hypothetical protein [Crenothrix polyspora]SJM95503.1 putative Chromosome partitioning protein [Crenothrix polyspora]
MVLAKRGLGRGLEALLVEMPVMAEKALHSHDLESSHNNQHNPFVVADLPHTQKLSEHKQPLSRVLLGEAEALKALLGDLEAILQRRSL